MKRMQMFNMIFAYSQLYKINVLHTLSLYLLKKKDSKVKPIIFVTTQLLSYNLYIIIKIVGTNIMTIERIYCAWCFAPTVT